jgi:putative peptidoglycan lipid II flippase
VSAPDAAPDAAEGPAHAAADGENGQSGPPRQRRRLAVSAAIFSIATGLSRIAGLIREILASSYFGTSGAFSAFTVAFQIPNLVRQLAADLAISSAFVPVFTELLEQRKLKEAFRLASTLFTLIVAVLGLITAAFIIAAPAIMPLFIGDTFTPQLKDLTVGLSQLLFPIVVLLGLFGLVVGILNAYDHFTVPALAPLVWNVVIIVLLVVLRPLFEGPDQLYAYAIAVLVATAVQLLMTLPMLPRVGFKITLEVDFRDPRLRQVLLLMLPIVLGLGVINFDLVINSLLGTLVSDQAPRAIDAAFRIYMLPQGLFSVALATVLFPTLSRFAARGDRDGLRRTLGVGTRQVFLLLVPASAFMFVLAEPITRLTYQRGEFGPESTELVSIALFWFAAAMPFAGVNLLLTRAFFSIQRPWLPAGLAAGSLVVNAGVSLALYRPFGIAGLVIGTAVASAAMTAGQLLWMRRELHGIEGPRTLRAVAEIIAASAALAGVSYVVWWTLDSLLGRDLIAQIVSVGAALAAGSAVYGIGVWLLRIPEGRQIWDLFAGRLRRRPASGA